MAIGVSCFGYLCHYYYHITCLNAVLLSLSYGILIFYILFICFVWYASALILVPWFGVPFLNSCRAVIPPTQEFWFGVLRSGATILKSPPQCSSFLLSWSRTDLKGYNLTCRRPMESCYFGKPVKFSVHMVSVVMFFCVREALFLWSGLSCCVMSIVWLMMLPSQGFKLPWCKID